MFREEQNEAEKAFRGSEGSRKVARAADSIHHVVDWRGAD